MADDPYDLARFVAAQDALFAQAFAEVRRGAKRTHWMWFVFPQLAGLGHSEMAQRFAIRSLDEAKAFLAHPVLGPRYIESVTALQDLVETDAVAVFGPIDAQKLRSSLTLFAMASGTSLIIAALTRWFGAADPATVSLLQI